MVEFVKYYESITDRQGREISIGEYVYGIVLAVHNGKSIAKAAISENNTANDCEPLLINFIIDPDYQNVGLEKPLFEATEFYYGDFDVEDGIHSDLTKHFELTSDAFTHKPVRVFTDKPFSCN